MRYPVDLINITNGFSIKHSGIDLGWNNSVGKNQPVYSCDDGIVVSSEKQSKGGNVIYIRHSNNIVSVYGHLKEGSIKVKSKEMVKKGQFIAKMGNTGVVTGNHLHFGLYKPNTNYYQSKNAINPLKYLIATSNQIIDPKTKYKNEIKYYENTQEYPTGIYKCLNNMIIRSEAGTSFKKIKVSATTKKARSALVSKKDNDNAIFKKNTRFTANKIIYSKDSIWAKTPNGYICIKDKNNIYCEKI